MDSDRYTCYACNVEYTPYDLPEIVAIRITHCYKEKHDGRDYLLRETITNASFCPECSLKLEQFVREQRRKITITVEKISEAERIYDNERT